MKTKATGQEALLDVKLLNIGDVPSEIQPAPGKLANTIQFITEQGIMRLERCELWEGMITEVQLVKPLAGLGAYRQYFVMFDTIGAATFARIVKFLRTMYEQHKSESEVMLLYKPKTENSPSEWDFYVPPQVVTHGSVNYTNNIEQLKPYFERGFMEVGTIHSHADFDAFHSGVDVADEENAASGIHLTVGHLDNPKGEFSLVMSGVISGKRFQYSGLDKVVQGIDIIVNGVGKSSRFKFKDSAEFDNYVVPDDIAARVTEPQRSYSRGASMGFNSENWRDRDGDDGMNSFGFREAVRTTYSQKFPVKSQESLSTHYGFDKNGVPIHDRNGTVISLAHRKEIAEKYVITDRTFFGLITNSEIEVVLSKKLPITGIINIGIDSNFGQHLAGIETKESTQEMAEEKPSSQSEEEQGQEKNAVTASGQ